MDTPARHQRGHFVEDAVLRDHVRGAVQRTGEHHLPMQRHALGLERRGIKRVVVGDDGQPALRRDQFRQPVQMLGGVRQRGDVADGWRWTIKQPSHAPAAMPMLKAAMCRPEATSVAWGAKRWACLTT